MTTPRAIRPLPPLRRHVRHLARNAGFAAVLLAISLGLGALGYHVLENLPWLDAVLNASMILAGMGPVDHVNSPSGKVFASAYAIFSGVVFLACATLVLAPVLRRTMHALHLDMQEK